jgi:hypothetical protein
MRSHLYERAGSTYPWGFPLILRIDTEHREKDTLFARGGMDVAGKILVERKRITTSLWSIFSIRIILSIPQNGQNPTRNSSYALAEGLG